ncbi:MAG: hypothetical protein M1833_002495 [Piccolia ochrophora]|nr:MAG: hypothetical protein M1833_002495 [Piccolia ochrophora]
MSFSYTASLHEKPLPPTPQSPSSSSSDYSQPNYDDVDSADSEHFFLQPTVYSASTSELPSPKTRLYDQPNSSLLSLRVKSGWTPTATLLPPLGARPSAGDPSGHKQPWRITKSAEISERPSPKARPTHERSPSSPSRLTELSSDPKSSAPRDRRRYELAPLQPRSRTLTVDERPESRFSDYTDSEEEQPTPRPAFLSYLRSSSSSGKEAKAQASPTCDEEPVVPRPAFLSYLRSPSSSGKELQIQKTQSYDASPLESQEHAHPNTETLGLTGVRVANKPWQGHRTVSTLWSPSTRSINGIKNGPPKDERDNIDRVSKHRANRPLRRIAMLMSLLQENASKAKSKVRRTAKGISLSRSARRRKQIKRKIRVIGVAGEYYDGKVVR